MGIATKKSLQSQADHWKKSPGHTHQPCHGFSVKCTKLVPWMVLGLPKKKEAFGKIHGLKKKRFNRLCHRLYNPPWFSLGSGSRSRCVDFWAFRTKRLWLKCLKESISRARSWVSPIALQSPWGWFLLGWWEKPPKKGWGWKRPLFWSTALIYTKHPNYTDFYTVGIYIPFLIKGSLGLQQGVKQLGTLHLKGPPAFSLWHHLNHPKV